MTRLADINSSSRSTGLTAWLALAAVLLLQLGAAAHEAQHSVSDAGDVCEICVQLDSTDATAPVADQPSPRLAGGKLRIGRQNAVYSIARFSAAQPRAPPALI